MRRLNDSQPLFSNSHKNTITPWYKKFLSRIKYWFVKPKLSENNLETVHFGVDFADPEGDIILYRVIKDGYTTIYTEEEFDKLNDHSL